MNLLYHERGNIRGVLSKIGFSKTLTHYEKDKTRRAPKIHLKSVTVHTNEFQYIQYTKDLYTVYFVFIQTI
jgi:hypothetical protein